jgi:hypothetical protein
MRHFQKVLENPEFSHEFERGRVNGVASEIPIEVPVLLEDKHRDPAARQQVTKHNARGATANNATCRFSAWLVHS